MTDLTAAALALALGSALALAALLERRAEMQHRVTRRA